MKKAKLFLLLTMLSFIFLGCNKKEASSNDLKSPRNGSYLLEINYDELNTLINSKEDFFFEVVQDGCSYCQAFTPKLAEVLNENKVIGYQLNLSNLSENDRIEFDKNFNVTGTPNTIFMTNGKELIMQRIDGNTTKTKIVSHLKSNGYIK